MPCHAMPCHAMPCHAMPCHAMPCHAMPCHAMPCHAMQCNAMQCNAMPCHPMLSYAIPSHPIPSYAMPFFAMPSYAMSTLIHVCCQMELRIDASIGNKTMSVTYKHFSVGNEPLSFRLTLGKVSVMRATTDSFSLSNGVSFSTSDNDPYSKKCASTV